MTDNVSVSFGADASDLLAKIALAKANVATFTAEVKSLASQMQATGQAGNAALGSALSAASADAAKARQTLASLNQELVGTGTAGHGAGAGISFYAREIHALADETLSGRLRQAQGTAANLLLTLAQARPDIAGAVVAFTALAGTVAYFVIQAKEASDALKAVKLALTIGDATGLADSDIKGLIKSIQQLPDSSYDMAKEVVTAFAEMQDTSAPLIKGLIASVGDFAAITGQKIPEAKKSLVDLFNAPLEAGARLRAMFPAITSAELEAYTAAQRSGNAYQAQAAILQILAQRMEAGRQLLRAEKVEQAEQQIATDSAADAAFGYVTILKDEGAAIDNATKRLRENITATTDAASALRSMPSTLDRTIKTGVEVGDKEGSPQETYDKQTVAIRKMSDALDGFRAKAATDPSAALEASIGRLALQLENAKNKAEALKGATQGGTDQALEAAMSKVAANLSNQSTRDQLALDIQADKDTLLHKQLTAEQIFSLNKEMSERIKQLQDVDAADARAKDELRAAQAAKGSAEEYAARASGIRATMAVQAQGSAAYTQSQTSLTELERQQEDARLALARDAEQAKTKFVVEGITERMQAIRAQAQEGVISNQEELTSLLALQKQKEEAEMAELTFKLGTYHDDANAYAKTQIDMINLTRTSMAERNGIVQSANKEMEASFKKTFEAVGSSISSAVMDILKGTGTMRDLLKSVASEIVQEFIQARIKMVADNLAGVAAKVAQAVMGETAQTEAAAQGAAARTGIAASGEAAAAGIKTVAATKSIISSSAETYAGVFGFLSPVLGPLAAGPATAAAASVSAVRSLVGFETGAWQTPGDMLAMVHRGEMIVPAGATPWAQSLMANAASGGGSGGGDTHHWNISVNGANRTPAQIVGEIKRNAAQIAGVLQQKLKTNPGQLGNW